jgi:2-octaprenyl-6-methoxyphenol hydroxylase
MDELAHLDVVIAGSGPAGFAAALACTQSGLRALVVDTSKSASTSAAKGRSAALFNSTVAFLERLGVWAACSAAAEPLRALQFIDDTGRRLRAPDCVFHANEIGETAFGHNIANADLVGALKAEAERLGLPMIAPGRLVSLRETANEAFLLFENGTEVGAPLIVAADGAMSATRAAAGIRTLAWSYEQIAIATSFSHERPHSGVCIELHRSAGPFTLVPLPGNKSSLVWVERKEEAGRLLALDDADFAREAEKVSRLALGRIFQVSERARFLLTALAVREFGRSRVALVGEAAHVTPPIGAQGLNLGFRDVEALTTLIAAARERGDDIGGQNLLRAYSASRRRDIVSRTFGADMLNRSLLSGFLPLQLARGLGLYALGAIGPLRRAFMRSGIAPAAVI